MRILSEKRAQKGKIAKRVAASLIAGATLLGGANLAFAGDGGAGSGGSGTGAGGNGSIMWAYQDNWGTPTADIVKQVMAQNGLSASTNATADANAAITQAITGALGECQTRYLASHPGGTPECRLTGLGALHTSGSFTGHLGNFTQAQWMDAWGATVGGKTYTYNGQNYQTTDAFSDGSTTIDSLVAREAAKNVALILIVLSQDEPKGEVPPDPPTKVITPGTSADSMTNTTTITSKTGTGGTKMVFKDTITPNGVKYTVGNQKVMDGSTDVSSQFAFAQSGDVVTATWKGGDLPADHTFQWSLDITVALPDVNKVTDQGHVDWNDKPTGDTDQHEFPTWTPSPDKAWIKYVDGKYESVIDPSRTNAVGADNGVILDGDSVAAAVNAPVSSNLAQAPSTFVVTDDFTAADYLVDLGDLKDAKVYLSDAEKGDVSSVADIVNSGTDVTDQFTIASDGTTVTATANDAFKSSLKGRAKAAQVTLVIPFTANYANGEGAAQVREDAGVKAGAEVDFCGVPFSSDVDGSDTPFLNAGSEKINNDTKQTNTPKICGYVPPVKKDVVAESSQGGDQSSVDGKKIIPGQKLEYKLQTDPKLPDSLLYDVTTVGVHDQYDEHTTADKQTLEVMDLNSGDVIPKTKYTTKWNDAKHSFDLALDSAWVKANWAAGSNPRIIVRFEATVDEDAPVTKTVDNDWTLTLNHSITPSNKVSNKPVDPKPTKEDTQKDASINIDGKTALLGDSIYYRINLDASDLADPAYKVQRLGLVDDYDEEYLDLDESAIQVLDASGADVAGKFNLEVKDGVVYAFFKTVDTLIPATGETVKGDPQPTDLKAYRSLKLDPLADPSIDQTVLGQDYQLVLPMTVKKVTDGYTVRNKATQITNQKEKDTNIVSNPLKEINPKKDVVVNVGGESVNDQSIYLNHLFLYGLDSSTVPTNRAYPTVTDWSLVDDYDQSHDRFTGQWAVYATQDVVGANGTVLVKKGGILASSSKAAEHNDWFTFMEKDGVFSLEATQAYLDIVSANNTSEQSWRLYVQMERTATGEVVNSFDETFNHVSRHSNQVKTRTPDRTPSIDLEKYDVKSGLKIGDRDTTEEALSVAGDTRIGFKITNTGKQVLGHIELTDKTIAGDGEVKNLEYPENWDSLELKPGESVTVYGTLTGVSTHHTNRGTVTGKPKIECPVVDEDPFDGVESTVDPNAVCWDTPVTDQDDWNGIHASTLATTGSDVTMIAVTTALLGGLGIGLSLLHKRGVIAARKGGAHRS